MQVVRFDKAEIKTDKSTWKKTTDGRLRVPVTLTRTGIFNYYDSTGKLIRELRSEEEVLKAESLQTMEGMYFTDEHPPEFLTPDNWKNYSTGTVGDTITPRKDNIITFIDSFLSVFDRNTQQLMEDGIKQEVSCGYTCRTIMDSGVWNGLPYDARQVDIKYNHVSLVKKGRAGSKVKIRRDSAEENVLIEAEINSNNNDICYNNINSSNQNDTKNTNYSVNLKNDNENEKQGRFYSMLIEGTEVKLDAVGEAILPKFIKAKEDKIAELEKQVAKIDSLEAKAAKLEMDLAEAQKIDVETLVKERVAVIEKAKNYVKNDSFDGKSIKDIKKQAVQEALKGKDFSQVTDGFYNEYFNLLENKPSVNTGSSSLRKDFEQGSKTNPEQKNDIDSLVDILVKADSKDKKGDK
jgi:hypothetical protein